MKKNLGHKKKIISFIDWYQPGYKAGGGQRAFANMVSYLRDTFDFYIITRNTDFLETIPYSNIKSDTWTKRAEGEYVYYCSEKKICNALYIKIIKEIHPDLSYINGIYSWKFSILPLITLKQLNFNGKKVLGTYGMLAKTAINIKKSKKELFIKVARGIGLYRNVLFHVTSNTEEHDVKNAFGQQARTQLAPHLPVKDIPNYKSLIKKTEELKLISIARISPEKNTLFALEKLRELGEFNGQINFDLYGPIYDKPYWTECMGIINQLPENIKVNYNGVVEGNKVLELFTKYHALFMPTRGENFGYVILESFMAGKPVLISDQTPWRDLEKKSCGWDLNLQHQNNKEWVSTITKLINMNNNEYIKFCSGSKQMAKSFINDPNLKIGNIQLFK